MNSMSRLVLSSLPIMALVMVGCWDVPSSDPPAEALTVETMSPNNAGHGSVTNPAEKPPEDKTMNSETITLGAGCFWCIEAVLDRIEGIESVESGYMGGLVKNPTYEQVCTGATNHAEVVQVTFDREKLPLDKLFDVFWQLHDPTTLNQQGFDVGTQYRSVIFYHSDEQKEAAEKSRDKWDKSGKFRSPIVTEISPASTFYRAEEYHQEYFARKPGDPYCRANILPKFKKLGLLKETDR